MRRKQLKRINEKIATLFLICLISLAITGYTYSHWTDIITILGTINTGNLKITIDNQKLIPNIGYSKTPDNKTVTISATITQGWQIWVGIIIKNNGTTPATITYGITPDNQPIWDAYFTHNEYFYGPYLTNPPPEVWNNAPTLPPPGGISTPPELLAQNKLVAWQNITLSGTPPAFTIEITVTYTATFHTWTDTVSVIYTLTYLP